MSSPIHDQYLCLLLSSWSGSKKCESVKTLSKTFKMCIRYTVYIESVEL